MMQAGEAEISHGTDMVSDEAMHDFLGYSLKRAYMSVRRETAGAMEDFGLKVRSFSALTLIVANPGISPSLLAEVLQMERPNVVLIIDELETRELISRTRDPKDRRRFALNATLRGKHVQQKTAAAAAAREEKITARFTAQEYEMLKVFLRRIGA